jgi:hypothetical protein
MHSEFAAEVTQILSDVRLLPQTDPITVGIYGFSSYVLLDKRGRIPPMYRLKDSGL